MPISFCLFLSFFLLLPLLLLLRPTVLRTRGKLPNSGWVAEHLVIRRKRPSGV